MTPEQISNIVRNDFALGQLGNQTWTSLYDAIHKDAATQATRDLGNERKVAAERARQLMPLERTKFLEELEKLRSETAKNYTTIGKLKSETAGQNLKNTLANETRALHRMMDERGITIDQLPDGLKIKALGDTAAVQYMNNVNDNKFVQHKEGFEAFARALGDSGAAGDADAANKFLPPDSTVGVLWVGNSDVFDGIADNSGITIQLPGNVTLGKVRELAKEKGITVQQVLEAIYRKSGTTRELNP